MPEIADIPDQQVPPAAGGGDQPSPSRVLYEKLHSADLYTKSYDDFTQKYSDPANRQKLYDGLRNAQTPLYTKSKDDFDKQYFSDQPSREMSMAPAKSPKVDGWNFANQVINGVNAMGQPIQMPTEKNDTKDYLNNEGAKSVDQINQHLANSDDAVKSLVRKDFEKRRQEIILSGQNGDPDAPQKLQALAAEGMNKVISNDNSQEEAFKAGIAGDKLRERQVLREKISLHPELKNDIEAATFLHDAQGDVNSKHAETIKKSYESIKKGDANYDVVHQNLTKPSGGVESFVRGFKDRNDELDRFNKYADNGYKDQDLIDQFKKERKDHDPYEPIPVGEGVTGHLGEMAGSNLIPMLKGGAVAGALTYAGQPNAGAALAAAINTPGYTKQAFMASARQGFNQLIDKGVPEEEAIKQAKHQAVIDAAAAGAQGAIQTYAGAKLGNVEGTGLKFSPGFKGVMQGVLKEGGAFGKEIGKSVGVNSALIGGLEVGKNAASHLTGFDRPLDENVGQAVASNAMFEVGLGILGKGGKGILKGGKNLLSKDKATIIQNIASQPTEKIDETLGHMQGQGTLTPDEVETAKNTIEVQKQKDNQIPAHVADQDTRVDIHRNIDKLDEINAQLKKPEDGGIHESMHAPLKDIKSRLEWENNMLSASPADQIKILKDKQVELQTKLDEHNEAKRSGQPGKLEFPDSDRAQLSMVKDKLEEIQEKENPKKSKVSVILPEANKPVRTFTIQKGDHLLKDADTLREIIDEAHFDEESSPLTFESEHKIHDIINKYESGEVGINEVRRGMVENGMNEKYVNTAISDKIGIKPEANDAKEVEGDTGGIQSLPPENNPIGNDAGAMAESTGNQLLGRGDTEGKAESSSSKTPPVEPPADDLPFSESEGSDKIGIAHRLQEDRMGEEHVIRGEGVTAEEAINHGRELLKKGRDPQKVADVFVKDGKISYDALSLVRAHYERLSRETNHAIDTHGENSPEANAAIDKESKWLAQVVKPMQTEWSKIGMTQQGATDIDTGTFTGMKRAYREETGKELTPIQARHAKTLSEKVRDLGNQVEELKSQLSKSIEDIHKERNSPKGVKQKAKELADAVRKGKLSRPDTFSAASPASLVWDTAIEIAAKTIETAGSIAEAVAKGVEHIKASEWYKGLDEPTQKNAIASFTEHLEEHKPSSDLYSRFATKKDANFTPEEVKEIWNYAKTEYLDKGASVGETLSKVGKDLGLNTKQVMTAISAPKGSRVILDEMYKKQQARIKAVNEAKRWIKKNDRPGGTKFLNWLPNAFFALKTAGHGTVGGITHAGMQIFQPSTWKVYFPGFIKQFKFAFGDSLKYAKAMEDLKNDDQFIPWKRAGLAVDPKETYDEYQGASKWLGKMGETGTRGFNALKVLRLDLAKYFYSKLSNIEKADPNSMKEIAKLVNHATGTSEVNFGKVQGAANAFLFAPKLEISRWQRLISDPAKAAQTFSRWDKASPAERAAAKRVAKNAGQMMATYMGALAANAGLLAAVGSKQKINFTDPTQSDWLKFKIGDKTIDVSGGMLSTAKLIYSLGEQGWLAYTGDKKQLSKKPGDKEGNLLLTQMRYKLSPFASTVADVFSGTDAMGKPLPFSHVKPKKGEERYTPTEYLLHQQTPIPISEGIRAAAESMKENGMTKVQVDDVLGGILTGALSGGTGAKLSPDRSLDAKPLTGRKARGPRQARSARSRQD